MITYSVSIGSQQVNGVVDSANKDIQSRLSIVRDKLLDFIEQAQVGSYQQNSNPTKPAGSPYIRTFQLKESSEKTVIGPMDGEWIASIDYAEYVIGPMSNQAPVHKGRWKSVEQVEKETEEKAPEIIKDVFG